MATETVRKQNTRSYNTLPRLNKTIKFWGLSPIQFTIIVLVGTIIVMLLIFAQQNIIVVGIVVAIMFFGFTLLLKNIRNETKKGNPDYLKGVTIKERTPPKIVDRHSLFKNLIKNGSNHNNNF